MIDIRDREEFEEWAEKNGLDTSMWDSKAYYSSPTTLAWKVWEDLHTTKIDALKAENEQLRKNAERYRWLSWKVEGWPTEEMIKAGLGAFWDAYGSNISQIAGPLEKAFEAMLAVAPAPPEQEGEPYCWIIRDAFGARVGYEDSKEHAEQLTKAGYKLAPLYTHPSNNGLRKAAEGVMDSVHEGNLYSASLTKRFWDALDNLRAELNKGN